MQIRTANIGDLQQITDIEAICFPEAEAASKESFQKRLTSYPNHFWLLEEEGVIVSFVNGMVTNQEHLTDEMYEDAGMHEETGVWQMIFGVDTIPEYRGRGCAGRLLQHVIAEAKAQGRKGLVLTCKEKLIHYYAKFGFVDEGISDSSHGNVVWHEMRLVFTE